MRLGEPFCKRAETHWGAVYSPPRGCSFPQSWRGCMYSARSYQWPLICRNNQASSGKDSSTAMEADDMSPVLFPSDRSNGEGFCKRAAPATVHFTEIV